MLSLPLIAPRDHVLYNSSSRTAAFQLDTQNATNGSQQQSGTNARRAAPSQISPLAQLRADENVIKQRKENVRRFGAGWLRPPGVAKTLQSKLEEQQEQLEQIELQRRDAELQAQEQAAQQAAMEAGDTEAAEGAAQERDLDDDVPDAEEVVMASDDESGDEADADTVPFSFVSEGTPVDYSLDHEHQAALEREDAELDGRLQDERDLGMDNDLDDVPEAGSYEHTDTEEEDSSSSDEEERAEPSVPRQAVIRREIRNRTSLASEDLESSSFLESSPAMSRRPPRGGFAGAAMGRRRRS